MPQIGANFQFTSRQPNFERDQFDTIAHMAACTVCDEGHKCYCLENQKTYEFTSVDSNGDAIEPNETTGYWHEFSSGGSGDVTGATIGSGASEQNVTKVGSILKFPAYPTVPITGIKDSNGNDINPLNGKVTLPAPPSVPITKIRIEGESSDLPINDGRVVIPKPPVKGIKTNGGTELTPDGNGKVTLPPIPADPSSRLTNIENTIQQIANAEPIVIPASAVELPTSANSTITYDSDDTYVMNISGTQIATVHYPYEHSTNSYLAFKAIDRDLYYVYQLTNAANNTYTFVEQHIYDELSHVEAKAVFEAGKYAVKQVIDVRHNGNPLPDNYFKHGIPSAFVTPDGYPLRYNQIKENNVYYILLKCDENNKIFKYSASNGKWSLVLGGCYIKDDATTGENYKKYDAYFDRQPASNVSFDDSITQFSTPQNPVTDVQTAINILATAIASNICITKVILKDYDGTFITSTNVYVSYVLNGETVVISNYSNPTLTTDSNGEVICNIPYGAIYTISFISKADRQKPVDITQMAENVHITHQALYLLQADVEQINLQVQVRGANNAAPEFDLTDKIVYIDYLNERYEVVVQAAMTCYLNAKGNIVRVVDTNNVETDTCLIPRGTIYKIRLSEWLNMIPSGDKIYTANKFTRSLVMYYSYTLSGLFIVIENYDINGNDLDTYTEYKCIDYDYNNNIVTIKDSQDNEWDVKYDSTEGILHTPHGTNTWGVWIDNSNLNRVLGIGVRSSSTINNDIFDDTGAPGYTDCSFILANNARTDSKWQNTNALWTSHPADLYSGRHNTNFMAISTEPESLMAKEAIAKTLKTGNIVQTGFVLAPYQARQLYLNKQDILLLTSVLHFTNGIQESWLNTIPTSVEKSGANGRDYWSEVDGSMSQNVTPKSDNTKTFVCFSF